MSGGEIVGLVSVICIFGGPFLVGIVYAVMKQWAKVARHREDVDLKHKLIDAGFSVDEIERVMSAGRSQGDDDQDGTSSDGDET